MKFGAHISIAGGIDKAPKRAFDLGCECFQFFSRSPRGGKAPELTDELIRSFFDELDKYNINDYYIHTPYYINLCSDKKELRDSSINIVKEELERGSKLGVKYIMTHLGSAKDGSRTKAISLIIQSLKKIMDNGKFTTKLLLENTAGQGATVGDSFEELGEILDELQNYNINICLDTAHMFASGHEIRTKKGFDNTIKLISKTVGIDKIKLFHGNDSKVDFGERKDRHEHIGKGKIGIEGFKNIVHSQLFKNIDMIVETPPDKVAEDIKTLKKLRKK
ncbi:MAG: deoxyribonuclease IV [Thermodesulfobacteriota bacterium]